MHRYWHDVFPEEFEDLYKDKKRENYKTILFGLQVVDKIIEDAMNFCKLNPNIILVFATSMGQGAIKYTLFEGYSAELEDVNKLFQMIGINPSGYKQTLAMVPQVSIEFNSAEVKSQIIEVLNRCHSISGQQLFSVEEAGNTMSVTIHTPPANDIASGVFILRKNNEKEVKIEWDKAGITMHKLEAATAYHIPEGIMAIYGKNIKSNDSREKIKLHCCKSLLLELAMS